jgi:UDP-N-acetylglucosamine--N-acetylmuramyl-(pentapeptide) pyrophosphoryl-undecaprenol N-acetylglucosamine transferase
VNIEVTGFDRARPWTLATALWHMRQARGELDRVFAKKGSPDVACGFGAYVEMPLLEWCRKRQVPYLIHEQNSVPGLANKTCAKGASTVCVSMPGALPAFEGHTGDGRLVVTGNPVRRQVVEASREAGRASFGIAEGETMLLVFGGSLGARHVNDAIAAMKGELLARSGLRIVHSCGKELFDEVVSELSLTEAEATRWQVMPYINNMGEALAAADVVVSRAGASSIAEIAALSVPSVLVPYPLATADHQTTNARYLTDAGGAILVPDDELDTPAFRDAVLGLVDDAGRRRQMREALLAMEQAHAAEALADEVERVIAQG